MKQIIFLLISFIFVYCKNSSSESASVDPNDRMGKQVDTLTPGILPPNADTAHDENWKGIDLSPKAPVKPKSPQEEQAQFLLPPGYSITPVLTEPAIQQPGAISFDGNGRMYVLELRSYMLTADSKNELEPISRISRWEDLDNDGVYEKGTTFVDHLVFPRFVLPYGKDAILTMESDADVVYKYTDTNRDGISDKKDFFTNKYGRTGNVEHQQAFMYYGMDNWLYSTVNAFRIRETANGMIREKTGANRAQWGITHDDDGKLWFQGGASGVPSYFQFPIHYGTFDYAGGLASGFDIPWGAAVKTADMQGGMDEIRQPDGSLNHVTGAAGNDIFRGDRLPKELYGQYFYGEPVARIVRQINPVVQGGLTTLHNAYQPQKSEWIRSTDPLFRPVDMTTAPDGTMYITSMYHGIIQEGEWTQKGSYLRTKIEQLQLDKVIQLGRIWRVTYEGMKRDTSRPHMFTETADQLVSHLSSPNGWWRDMAQQMIVLNKQNSVSPALKSLISNDKNIITRIAALWTLEGLQGIDSALVISLLKDANPRMRIQALRVSESLYKNGQKSLANEYKKLLADKDTNVVMQALLTSKYTEVPDLKKWITSLIKTNKAIGVKVVGDQILNPPIPMNLGPFGAPTLSDQEKESVSRGLITYNELCSTCHGATGTGIPSGDKLMAPPLAGSQRVQGHPEYIIRVLLHGMEGPIESTSYTGNIMTPMAHQSDEWIADVLSFIRNGLSNDASLITADQVKALREKSKDDKKPYKYEILKNAIPFEIKDGLKLSASSVAATRIGGNKSTNSALTYEGWSTGEKQAKGQWFSVEFPKEVNLSEIRFASIQSIKKGWRPGPMPKNGIRPPGFSIPFIQSYPRNYKIENSSDGKSWNTTLAEVKGVPGMNVVNISGDHTRYVRFTLNDGIANDSLDTPWSMKQMQFFVRNQ